MSSACSSTIFIKFYLYPNIISRTKLVFKLKMSRDESHRILTRNHIEIHLDLIKQIEMGCTRRIEDLFIITSDNGHVYVSSSV